MFKESVRALFNTTMDNESLVTMRTRFFKQKQDNGVKKIIGSKNNRVRRPKEIVNRTAVVQPY